MATKPRKKIVPSTTDRPLTFAKEPEASMTNVPRTAVIPQSTEGKTAKDVADETGDKVVTVNVPKAFILTDDLHREFRYAAGACKMPSSHADHWYSLANGVTKV